MNKLIITQTKENGIVEQNVPTNVINTLYSIGKDDDENQTLTSGVDTTDVNRPVTSVSGAIRVAVAYANQLDYVRTKYPNLDITADSTYISFADPEVERALLAAGIGDGVGISVTDAATANLGTIFSNNTTITNFDEFNYFTRTNTIPTSTMFLNCTNLESINLSELTIAADGMFRLSGIKEIDAPSLSSMSSNFCLTCTSLETVKNLGNILYVGINAFLYCNALRSVVLPSTCYAIMQNAFGACTYLSSINLSNITQYGIGAFDGDNSLNIPVDDLQNAISIGDVCFRRNIISGELNLPKLKSIGTWAFAGVTLITKVKCLGTVSSIPNNCFFGWNTTMGMTEVYMPYECTSIGNLAFAGCKFLTTLKQYDKSVDDWDTDDYNSFKDHPTITNIGSFAFNGCTNLTSLDFTNVTTIGEGAFQNSGFAGTLNAPNLTATLNQNAFNNTAVSKVENLGSITYIKGGVFSNCPNLTEISIPKTLILMDYTFNGGSTKVKQLIFPRGFKTMTGNWGIGENSSAEEYIQFPDTFETGSFLGCYITTPEYNRKCIVVIQATTPPTSGYTKNNNSWKNNAYDAFPESIRWYVPDSAVDTYKENADWSTIADSIHPISQLEIDSPTYWEVYQANKDY